MLYKKFLSLLFLLEDVNKVYQGVYTLLKTHSAQEGANGLL